MQAPANADILIKCQVRIVRLQRLPGTLFYLGNNMLNLLIGYIVVSYVVGGIVYLCRRTNDEIGILPLCFATSPMSMPLIAYLFIAHKLTQAKQ